MKKKIALSIIILGWVCGLLFAQRLTQTPAAMQVTLDNAETTALRYIGQNAQTGTTYTLVLTDAGKIIEMNNGAANTLTIPANASVAFPVNTRMDIIQYNTGTTSIAITTDTLRGSTNCAGQYKAMSLWKRTTNEWIVIGGTD